MLALECIPERGIPPLWIACLLKWFLRLMCQSAILWLFRSGIRCDHGAVRVLPTAIPQGGHGGSLAGEEKPSALWFECRQKDVSGETKHGAGWRHVVCPEPNSAHRPRRALLTSRVHLPYTAWMAGTARTHTNSSFPHRCVPPPGLRASAGAMPLPVRGQGVSTQPWEAQEVLPHETAAAERRIRGEHRFPASRSALYVHLYGQNHHTTPDKRERARQE